MPAPLPLVAPPWQVAYPPLVTDKRATELALGAAAKVVGSTNARELPEPFM